MKYVMLIIAAAPTLALAEVVPPTYLDGVLAFLAGHPVASLSVILAVVADLGLRVYPSEKALSVLVPVKYAVDSMKAMLAWMSGIIDAFVQAAQNLKK